MRNVSFSGRAQNILFCLAAVLLTGVLTWLMFGHLDSAWINDYDEARHGVNAYEMIRNGDYIVNTYQGEPDDWNLKPPLSLWLISLSYRIFEYNAFALRFFSALAGLLAALAVALWAGRNSGRGAALFTLLAFAGLSQLYGLHFARYGDADAQYQLFFTLAVLCALSARRNLRLWYLCALFFGLAFLEKGLHAANVVLVCFAILLATGQRRRLTVRRVALILLAGLAPILPWAIARYVRDGFTFFSNMFVTDVAGRIGTVADPADAGLAALPYYLTVFTRSPGMIVCLAVCGLSAAALLWGQTALSPAERGTIVGCALWLTLPVAFYAVANVKYRWYVYSALYALPALTASLLAPAWRAAGRRWKKALAAGLAAAAVALAVCAGLNFATVATSSSHTVQDFLKEDLDRSVDKGVHAYIQFSENRSTVWMQGDMLVALFSGDVVCLDGGADAYLADESSAILYVCRDGNEETIESLEAEESVRNENYYIVAFEK